MLVSLELQERKHSERLRFLSDPDGQSPQLNWAEGKGREKAIEEILHILWCATECKDEGAYHFPVALETDWEP